jgi:hypothetical protein
MKSILRVGDRVRIVNPTIFCRCGYEWNKQYVKDNIITPQQKNALRDLMITFGIMNEGHIDILDDGHIKFIPDACVNEYDKLLDELAYAILKKNHFGGRERKIFTEYKPEFLNREGVVGVRKVYQTGTYERGLWCYDEYDPPFLGNLKAHVIFNVFLDTPTIDWMAEGLRIENIHLQKI